MIFDTVTLQDFIDFNRVIVPLNKEYAKLQELEISQHRKDVLLTSVFVKKAVKTFEKFGEKSTSDINTINVDFLISWYNDFLLQFHVDDNAAVWKSVGLYQPELTHMAPVTFGQFIDAKMLVEGAITNGQDRWEVVQYLMAIFLIGKKSYDDTFTAETNGHFIRQAKKPMNIAVIVSAWWEQLTKYTQQHYTVFQESGDRHENSENIDEHMQRWGWVNFLKNISKTKAFDISGSGLNSIDCVRRTKASEILVWASEEKEYNVAMNRDMKNV